MKTFAIAFLLVAIFSFFVFLNSVDVGNTFVGITNIGVILVCALLSTMFFLLNGKKIHNRKHH